MVVPLSVCYSPWKRFDDERPIARYHPVTCRGCSAVLNPYCQVDVNARLWTCPFCVTRNQLPAQYADISETNLPAELIPTLTTLDYRLPQAPAFPPVFLFVIDLALDDDELQGLKDSILMALDLMPENCVVGLITYAATVHVYELGFEAMPKAHVFNGEKDVTSQQVHQFLGISGGQQRAGQAGAAPAAMSANNMFLRPFSSCRSHLEGILEELQRDPTPTASGKRPKRATGVAMAVAVGLMEASCAMSAGRIQLFSGGPCTVGPGAVTSDVLTDMMRSHHDITKDNAAFLTSGTAYNDALACRAAQAGHVVDIFTCCLDQTGLLEQIGFLRRGGGVSVLEDSFCGKEFQESFRRIFVPHAGEEELDMAFNATLEVHMSKELRVMGMIGPGISGGKKGTAVSETSVGVGGTTAWRIAAADHRTSPSFFFEVVNPHNQAIATPFGMVQFITNYTLSTGEKAMRVTTIARSWANYVQDAAAAQQQVEAGFDQETAAVVMARVAMTKTDIDSPFDIIRWVDRSLIRFVQKVAQYTKDQPASFALQPHFSLFPQFMFHLRRSPFLQVFNNSPDETAWQRYLLMREKVGNCVTMIQPTLDRYSFNGPPEPALLSAHTLSPDCILLLDTFFQVVIWTGSTMADWRKKGFMNDPNYASFKALLEAPPADAIQIIEERFPVVRIIECDQHTSQARFLTATVDPCVTYNNTTASSGPAGGEAIFTEDVSLSVFMDHLKKLCVQPQ